ncbi:inorganic triphosphatase [Glaesserella sp.]|uniref:CYTH domain-containing protein n=1 Tax=Glaesserella sp. TaxID=2094731 RepID=UPI0035A04694
MEQEIELKIILTPNNIPRLTDWLNQLPILKQSKNTLKNTYYDSPDQYFARQHMGLRVRNKQERFELTLKTQGEIIGGLHIRPEYNLDLPDAYPDFRRLAATFNLPFDDVNQLQQSLQPTFSTDFTRIQWLIGFQSSQIDIAFDRGMIRNTQGQEEICELEFELKQGSLIDLITLLELMPKTDGMWLSGLSKAQRGYFVGHPEKIAKEIEKLTACNLHTLSEKEQYRVEQQLADFIRLTNHLELYRILDRPLPASIDYFYSDEYLSKNINLIKRFYPQ